jgi:hypothetical protein
VEGIFSLKKKVQMNDSYYSRKEMYNIQDDRIGSVGPMDIATLKAWCDAGMVEPTAFVLEVGSSQQVTVQSVLTSRPIQGNPPPDWYLWMDNKCPFNNMINRISKCFTSRQSLSDVKITSISNSQVSFTAVQDFELFLEQGYEISPAVKSMKLNKLAQPFAQWTMKIFENLKAVVTPEEVIELLLSPEPKIARKFIQEKVPFESYANKFFSVYNQWRVYIPIFIDPSS